MHELQPLDLTMQHPLSQGFAHPQVRSLDWEDPLEKEMATHSRILVWKISWTEEPGGLQSTELQRVGPK